MQMDTISTKLVSAQWGGRALEKSVCVCVPIDLCAVRRDQRSTLSISLQAPPTLFVKTRSLTSLELTD